MRWKTRRKTLDLSHGWQLMGILNMTPDSFSDGGTLSGVDAAVERAIGLVADGASIIDIGGESTRPGAAEVSAQEEIMRTVPVVRALREVSDVLISIDTSKADVAAAAIEHGADIVNDVSGLLHDAAMAKLCAKTKVGVVAMHMQGTPRTMQDQPDYSKDGGVVQAVSCFFEERLRALLEAGIEEEAICFDPGIGFGKTLAHNVDLLDNLHHLQKRRPILLGVSRKSMLGMLADKNDPAKTNANLRDPATAEASVAALTQGIRLHRVHNVSLVNEAFRNCE